jgi:hypothetical protein
MMTNAFSTRYFEWLTNQIRIESDDKTYNDLFMRLQWKEFVWLVANDDNRIGDALELRREFWGEGTFIPENPVSVLEVIIALARRLAFQDDGDAELWAWVLIKNLGLQKYSDPLTKTRLRTVDDILESLIFRMYQPNGRGGFFPLKHPQEDQRKVEIWYQMSAYIIERS